MSEGISIAKIIKQHLNQDIWEWHIEKGKLVSTEKNAIELNKTFAFIPRKTGNGKLAYKEPQPVEGLNIQDWTIDRLTRVWLLMQLDTEDKHGYIEKIETLFSAATMNELVALYSALPVLAHATAWQKRCAEGIRSNIGSVLEAIMYENSYPSHYLDEPAWNQMVLKAFFTDKKIGRIAGIDDRANPVLAHVLFDYAHERWAAGRTVNPQLWRLTGKFLNAGSFPDIQKLYAQDELGKKAALLACSQSDYTPAKLLLDSEPLLKKDIIDGKLHWNNLESAASY